jgi:hypothetical protein
LVIGLSELSTSTLCTTSRYRRISRWEHEAVLETMQAQLNQRPDAMRNILRHCEREGTS